MTTFRGAIAFVGSTTRVALSQRRRKDAPPVQTLTIALNAITRGTGGRFAFVVQPAREREPCDGDPGMRQLMTPRMYVEVLR